MNTYISDELLVDESINKGGILILKTMRRNKFISSIIILLVYAIPVKSQKCVAECFYKNGKNDRYSINDTLFYDIESKIINDSSIDSFKITCYCENNMKSICYYENYKSGTLFERKLYEENGKYLNQYTKTNLKFIELGINFQENLHMRRYSSLNQSWWNSVAFSSDTTNMRINHVASFANDTAFVTKFNGTNILSIEKYTNDKVFELVYYYPNGYPKKHIYGIDNKFIVKGYYPNNILWFEGEMLLYDRSISNKEILIDDKNLENQIYELGFSNIGIWKIYTGDVIKEIKFQ